MIKMATWNVNSVRARLPLVIQWLREKAPHIVLFQETKTEDQHFPSVPLEDLGYNLKIYGQKTYNGVALLSKFPIEDLSTGLSGMEEGGARYIEAVTGGFRVASLYVPNGQDLESSHYISKKKFLENLALHAEHLLTYQEPVILGGDYNIAPHDEDVYSPSFFKEKLICSTEERSWFRRLLYLGYIDALREEKNKNLFTWWDYRAGARLKNEGLRIDHLLLSPQAADRLHQTGVDTEVRDWKKTSDHAPVWASFYN